MNRPLRRAISTLVAVVALAFATAIGLSFPWSTDPDTDESFATANADFYRKAYAKGAESKGAGEAAPLSAKEQFYVEFARQAALHYGVPDLVAAFVRIYGLQGAKTLEVGAGSGLLQDIVPDYTGLDISPTARRFFHKPFVEASATAMPFPSNSFDLIWSVWVLEHIPNPEAALLEMRRVVKPGGYLFLLPAYDVDHYRAQGYRVRPYADFDWQGKLVKATVPVFESQAYHLLQARPIRLIRYWTARLDGGPSRFRFRKLKANYDEYWEGDSDATTSFTRYEMYLWFASRGDRMHETPSPEQMMLHDSPQGPLVIQVRK